MIEAPEPPHHHAHPPASWFDRLLGVVVVLSSLASLYMARHTGLAMQSLVEQNARLVRANSTPLLQLQTGNLADDGHTQALGFELDNDGTGPARIVWLNLSVDDHAVHDATEVAHLVDIHHASLTTNRVTSTIIRTGESRTFLLWTRPTDNPAMQAAWDKLDRMRLRKTTATACYCSLLDQCWTSTLNGDVPRPVDRCTPPLDESWRG